MSQLSLVLIIPSNLLTSANAIANALGYGPITFSVPLSPTGETPITDYGGRANTSESFVAWLNNAVAGNYPLIENVAPSTVQTVFESLIFNVSDILWGGEHFFAVLNQEGLSIVEDT